MINIVTDLGCCAGVKSALKTIENIKKNYPNKQIIFNHSLVHNKKTLVELDPQGSIKVRPNIDEQANSNEILVFSAHGHEEQDEMKTDKYFKVEDALCPLLKGHYAQFDKANNDSNVMVLFYGDRNHPETKAILSRFKNFKFIDCKVDFLSQLTELYEREKEKIHSFLCYSQSTILTLPNEEIRAFCDGNNVRLLNSFKPCYALECRVNQIVNFKIDENKVNYFIILGDVESSNARELYKLVNNKFPQCESVLVNSVEELYNFVKNVDKKNEKDYNFVSSTSITDNSARNIIDWLDNYLNS